MKEGRWGRRRFRDSGDDPDREAARLGKVGVKALDTADDAQDARRLANGSELPDDALVVRGGTNTTDRIAGGAEHIDEAG